MQSTVSGLVDIGLASGINLITRTVIYYQTSDYSKIYTITTGTNSITGPTSLGTWDTTTLPNGGYILQVQNILSSGQCQVSRVLVNIVGENKPGRVTFTVNDFTVPLAGLPIVIGRTYDSLERSQDGDFGNGWKLSIGNPKLEVNPAGDVTLTLLDGRRVKFGFAPFPPSPVFGFLLTPNYVGEPGAYGTLSAGQGGCPIIATGGSSGGYVCFLSFTGANYAPTTYQYRDPYGRLYEIAAPSVNGSISTPGKLLSITDLNGNKLTYDATGIQVTGNQAIPNNSGCPSGYLVCFGRTGSRITTITDTTGTIYQYGYASTCC